MWANIELILGDGKERKKGDRQRERERENRRNKGRDHETAREKALGPQ